MRRLSWILVLLAGPALAELPVGDPSVGRELVEGLCGGCHAVDESRQSPISEAPPFIDLVDRWPPSHLAEALAEGIVVGHGAVRMPEFRLHPDDIEDVISYLEELEAVAAGD
jgi:cytochrome c